jgi:hypothetical protein
MPNNPTQQLTLTEFDAIASIAAYYENHLEGPDFLYPPMTYSIFHAMTYLKSPAVPLSINTRPIWSNIVEHGEGINFGRKDVGALFRYSRGNHTSFVTTEYLMNLPKRRNLTDAQLHEVEHLLNKADRTLGAALPSLPTATDQEMKDALFSLLMVEIEKKPRYYYQNFIDAMAQKGTPVDLANKDFKAMVTGLLKV